MAESFFDSLKRSASRNAGALTGEPIACVHAETVDVLVPATSEIVVEGHVSMTDTAPEGPMGEYAGSS